MQLAPYLCLVICNVSQTAFLLLFMSTRVDKKDQTIEHHPCSPENLVRFDLFQRSKNISKHFSQISTSVGPTEIPQWLLGA